MPIRLLRLRLLWPALLLLLVARAGGAEEPVAGRHRVWEASQQEAVAALARGDAPAARTFLLAAIREAVRFPEADPRTARTIETFDRVQRLLFASGGAGAVQRLFEEADALAVAAGPRAIVFHLDATSRMATVALLMGQNQRAEKLSSAALASAVDHYGADHPLTGRVRALQLAAIAAQDPQRGVTAAQAYVDEARESAGVGSPMYGDALIALAGAHQKAAWPERGISPAEQALAIQESVLGKGAPAALATRFLLVDLYLGAGRGADARRGLAELRPYVTQKPEQLVHFQSFVAHAAIWSADLQEAVDALAVARDARGAVPPEAPVHVTLRIFEALVFELQGELDEAAEQLERLLTELSASGRGNDSSAGPVRFHLARVESRRGNMARVEELLKPTLRGDASHVDSRSHALNTLAYAYARNGPVSDALPLAARAVALLAERYGADNPRLAGALGTLGRAQLEQGRLAEARATYERVFAMLAQRPDSVAAERETWRDYALLAKRLGDDVELRRAEAEVERRSELLERKVVRREPREAAQELAVVENETFNYRFRPPGPEWVPFDASGANPIASLGYVRRDPDAFLMIASEAIGAGASLGADGLAALVAAGMDKGLTLVSREPRRVAGMDGVLLLLEGPIQGQPSRFAVWVTIQGGFAHQLMLWTSSASADRAALDRLAMASFAGFAPLDPGRSASATVEPAGKLRSERYGYEVDLDDTEWRVWPESERRFAHAEHAALLGQHAALVVVPVALFGREPGLDALAVGFQPLLKGLDATAARAIRHGGADAREIEFTQDIEGRAYRFRARVLRGDDVAILTAAWVMAALGPKGDEVLDVLDRLDLDDASPPPEPGALEPAERERHAVVFNEMGVHHLERTERLAALDCLELALAIVPDDPLVLENDVLALTQLGRFADALTRLEVARATVEASQQLLAVRAVVRQELGRTDEALADYADAFAGGLADPGAELRYSELLHANGDRAGARSFLEARIAAGGGVEIRRQHARLLRLDGEAPASIAELTALLEQSPTDVATLFELAESQAAAADPAAVVRTCDRILASTPDAYAYYLKARAQVEQGDAAAAKASLEAALAIQPDAAGAREYLAHVSAMLGQGDASDLRTPIAALALPARIRQLRDGSAAPAAPGAASAVTLWLVKGFHFDDGKELRSTLWWKVKALDERGVEQLSRLEFPLNPLHESLYVESLIVRDAKGREVSRGQASDAYVLHAPENDQATSTKRAYIPVRGLAPGATIELVLSQREKAAPGRFSYVDWTLAGALPAGRSLLFVSGDLAPLRTVASAGITQERGDGWQAWWMDQPPVDRWEPNQPARRGYLPRVEIGDRRDDWAPLARQYLEEIHETLAPDPALIERARDEVVGLDDADARARALARYVQRLLTYQAIAFGRRARMPKPPAEVLELRYGDCKDHAVLLHQLLEGAGVSSRLALASFGAPIQPNVPSLDQFDHMIVRCLDCKEARFLDATDKSLAPGAEVPRGLAGTSVLVLDPDQPRLEEIPEPALERHYASSERRVAAGEDGTLRVEEEVELGGYPAAWIRDFLRATDRAGWKDLMRRLLLAASDEIEAIDVEALEATERPLRLRMTYSVHDGFSKSTRGWIGRTPAVWETWLLGIEQASERKTPFELPTPMRVRGSVRVTGPSGHSLRAPPQPEIARAGRFTELVGGVSAEPDGFRMRYEITRRAGEGAPQGYASVREETTRVFEFLRQPFEAEPNAP